MVFAVDLVKGADVFDVGFGDEGDTRADVFGHRGGDEGGREGRGRGGGVVVRASDGGMLWWIEVGEAEQEAILRAASNEAGSFDRQGQCNATCESPGTGDEPVSCGWRPHITK